MLIRLLLAAALAGYAAAWLLQIFTFRGGDARHRFRSFVFGAAGGALHTLALVVFWARFRTPPLVGFGPATTTLALALVIGFMIASRTRERWATGIVVLPLVGILLVTGLVVGIEPSAAAGRLHGPWLTAHVLLVFAGYASLLLASVAAAMYLLQFRALKRKDFGNVFRFFPSLESLDQMNRIGLAGGLSVLAIGLLAGWSLTLTFGAGLSLRNPDVAFGLITWTAYAIALAMRGSEAGFGTRAATSSAIAFAASGIAFLVIRALGSTPELFL